MAQRAATAPRFYMGKRASTTAVRSVAFVLLCIGSVLALIPVLWMLSTSLKSSGDVLLLPPKWIPDPIMWSNYVTAWQAQPFGLYYFNTILYTGLAVIGDTF